MKKRESQSTEENNSSSKHLEVFTLGMNTIHPSSPCLTPGALLCCQLEREFVPFTLGTKLCSMTELVVRHTVHD